MTGAGESMDDPRPLPASAAPETAGIRPVVRLPRAGVPVWMIGIGVIGAGLLLFGVLDARRRSLSAPAVAVQSAGSEADGGAGSASPPPLVIPPEPPPPPVAIQAPPPPPPPPPAPPPPPQIVYLPQPAAAAPAAPPAPRRLSTEPALVIDTGNAPAGSAANQPRPGQAPNQPPNPAAAQAAAQAAASATTASGDRVRSSVFANPSTTVVQGTLVPAVLETALDSTRPGYARATVSRDVRGFDGKNILIPRGTKLIGSYSSQVAQGQKRALVSWDRLIRPDGVTIAIGSPAADPLGGGGIPAKVNSHFFERFAGTILQSVLNIGVNVGSALATKAVDNTIVILPNGSSQGIGAAPQLIQPGQITPTLTVKAGTSVSIFVARDLDFTGAEARK